MESTDEVKSAPSSPHAPEVTEATHADSPTSDPARKAVPVSFVATAATTTVENHVDIHEAGHGSRGPARTSKRISFFDDGKLFEGHLTVQSRNLKAIMQYLVDRQAEQSIIIEDLQHQLQTLRNRNAKKRRLGAFGYGAGGAGLGAGGEALEQRVTLLESFVRLWGIRPEDVEQLVKDYGDPVITPDPYTAYLLDLPSFRTARREARALLTTTTGRPSITPATVMTANDTGSRRAAARQGSDGQDRETSGVESAPTAQQAFNMAVEALHRLDALSAGGSAGKERKPLPRPAADEAVSPLTTTTTTVDTQARQDIAELGDYVMDRFRELEARAVVPPSNMPTGASRKAPSKAKPSPNAAPPVVMPSSGAGVDEVAREDAAASLEMISELEVYMEKRFKELSTAIANVALRKTTAPGGVAPAPAPVAASAEREGPRKNKKKTSRPASPATPPSQSLPPFAAQPQPLVTTPPPPQAPMGPFEDTLAREETVALSERLDDLEGELGARFQAFEERLRIVGRASMQPKTTSSNAHSGGTGPAIDRKAREDASMSLMRVQQLERELTALKRQLALMTNATTTNNSDAFKPGASGLVAGEGHEAELTVHLAPPADLKDTYNTRVQDLEKEVAQRMADVNRAITMLKTGPSSDPYQQSLLDLLAGQSLFAQAAVPSPGPRSDLEGLQSGGGSPFSTSGARGVTTQDRSHTSIEAPTTSTTATTERTNGGADRHTLVLRSQALADELDYVPDVAPRDYAAGPRRVTVSRLRPPDAPLMGVPLVERNVDVDRLIAELAPPALPARMRADRDAPAAPFGTQERHASNTSSPVKQSLSPTKATTAAPRLPALPPSPTPSGGRRSPVPTAITVTSARRPTTTASLGHTKPCVVLNCAWCAAEKQSARTTFAQ